jgi:TRAP-type C4-dicarboxylate transport system permease small subunit
MKKTILILLVLGIIVLPNLVYAADLCVNNPTANQICNPLGGNDQTVPDFVQLVMKAIANIIGLIAISMIVYAGVRFLISNGDPAKIKEAKSSLTYTVAGFVVAVMAYAGVLAIENFLGVESVTPTNGIDEPFNPFNVGLRGLVSNVLTNTILISGLVAMFMIILNGFRYLTARGDEDQIKVAKSGLLWSILGLVIILFAYVIISAVARLLG